jgi:tetratricopeptide (TPR) repeat protein
MDPCGRTQGVSIDQTTIMKKLTERLLKGVMFRVCMFVAILAAPLWADDLERARQLYQRTEYEAALQALGAEGSPDARGMLLAGQIYYQLGQYKAASERLQKASQLEPRSAEIFLWLGRSLGRQAETSTFTAFGYARQCRQALEQAVALDGKHVEAMSALASYYVKAPSALGGSPEKAEKLVAQIAALDAAQGQYVRAQMAAHRKDFARAEEHLQRAAEMAPDSPKLLFARAELYIQQKRKLEEARVLLRRYLQMPLTPEDPPRGEAERLLVEAGG